jgi:hypothetical protein
VQNTLDEAGRHAIEGRALDALDGLSCKFKLHDLYGHSN